MNKVERAITLTQKIQTENDFVTQNDYVIELQDLKLDMTNEERKRFVGLWFEGGGL